MVTVAGKTVDFQGIAGFLMGLKLDIISIHHRFWFKDLLAKLYVELAKGNTPEGSLKKNNYRVEKKRTSW